MNDDISRALARLAEQPVPVNLAQTEVHVLARVAEFGPRLRKLPAKVWVGAAGLALAMGLLAGFTASAGREPPLFPLASDTRLAPSSLLTE